MENQGQFAAFQSNLPRKQVVAALVGTMLSMFLGSMFMTVASTAMPRIVTDLGGFSQYTWVFTSYIITETIAVPITGKLSDMFGRKWLLVVGMVIFTLGSFLCGISQSITELVIFRAFQGIGFGMMSALGFIVIADIFPPEERGKYGGLMAGVFGLSTLIGPTLGGFLTDTFSWRWVFFAPIPFGVIIIIIFIFLFPQLKTSQEKHKIDYLGVMTMTLFIGPLILALTWGGVDYAWGSPVILGTLVFSVFMLAAFLFVESRVEEPIIPLTLFKNRVMAVSAAVGLFMGAAFFPVVTFIPLYFQGVLGAEATESGVFLTPMMLAAAAGSFISGQMLSRAGGHYRLQGTIGFVISAVGFFLLTMMTPQTSFGVAVVYIIIVGLGNGMIMPIHTIAVQNTVPYAVMGTATSMIQLLRPLGGVFGLAVVGSILNNTFASSFLSNLSPDVKAVVPPEQLAAIVNNPQALVSPEAQAQMQGMFEGLGSQGPALFEQMLTTLREALNTALIQVFMMFFIVTILGLVANFFLKGIPPHRTRQGEPTQESA
jgi:EmrB/QacA subfamily drug resistance transporter